MSDMLLVCGIGSFADSLKKASRVFFHMANKKIFNSRNL
jgi:hypothetical protein